MTRGCFGSSFDRRPLLSVVIPVYCSEATLDSLYKRLTSVLSRHGLSYELVFVEDGSPDNAWRVLEELARTDFQHVVAIRLMRNYGQHNALMCGFRYTRGDIVLTMDDDLQNPPEEIPKLVQYCVDGEYDLVYARYEEKRHHAGRNLGSWLVNTFFRFVFRSEVTVTSFRAMRRELLDAILPYNLNFTFVDGLLAWNTQRVGHVLVEHHSRENGHSGYSFAKLLSLALNLFTNFSLLPLQVASATGFLAALVGLGTGGYYLVQALFHNIAVPGYASTIVAVMVLGGLQLLALGIIGEYIGRVHLNINRKPQYTVREVRGAAVKTANRGVFSNDLM